MKDMIFRKAEKADLEAIGRIIRQAKERMRLRGSEQWQGEYPGIGDITNDLALGYGYVLSLSGTVIAYAAVVFDGEPAYASINGKWLSDRPYIVVHRLAVANEAKGRGVALLFLQAIEELGRGKGVRSFRVDTNFDNASMLKILERLGFTYCGEISYASGVRMAFEKALR